MYGFFILFFLTKLSSFKYLLLTFHISETINKPIKIITYCFFNFCFINIIKIPKDISIKRNDLQESEISKDDLSETILSKNPFGILTEFDIGIKSFSERKSKKNVGNKANNNEIPPTI